MKPHLHAKHLVVEGALGKGKEKHSLMVWNPNSLDNSKILLEPLYQASKRHITKNWLISVFKIVSYVSFASHSKKGIII